MIARLVASVVKPPATPVHIAFAMTSEHVLMTAIVSVNHMKPPTVPIIAIAHAICRRVVANRTMIAM